MRELHIVFAKPLDFSSPLWYNIISLRLRDVAQFGRALRSGRRGRRFESCHLDHEAHDRYVAWGNYRGLHCCSPLFSYDFISA